MKVLLSIKPEYVEEIIKGNKKFEYRKRIFKREVESVVIYCTMPVGKIVGEFTIDSIINESPKKIWNMTSSYSGISRDSFLNYFSGRSDGFAIKIKNFVEYEKPINPREIDDHFVAPQSYKYINNENDFFVKEANI